MKSYFFDTYALFETLEGNPHYLQYNGGFMTSLLNLLELHYGYMKYGEKKADEIFEGLKPFVTEIDAEVIKAASKFREKNKKLKLSYIDCIGYMMALHHGVKFLTGDKAFEGMENVEFVQ